MLCNLKIENYALIDHLDIDFEAGMSSITGETGAGKSIILGALALVLGSRADSKVIPSEEKKCIVEATFDISRYHLKPLFERLDLDYDEECILRREVLQNGKSRAFANDTPVNLQQLREISSSLIDIHSQHENLMLSDSGFQMSIVDTVSQSFEELERYRATFLEYKNLNKSLQDLRDNAEKLLSEKDYAEFQLAEFAEANLQEGEQEELEQELNSLNHSQEISEGFSQALQIFQAEQFGVAQQLKSAAQTLQRISSYMPKAEEFAERVSSVQIEVEDVAAEIERILSDTEFSADRKAFVEERLNTIYSLQQKHRVSTLSELFEIEAEFQRKLSMIENFDDEIAELERKIKQAEQTLREQASELTAKRLLAKPVIESEVGKSLAELGMPNGSIEVAFDRLETFSQSGLDRVELLFSANKNREKQNISQVASGGEISRLMLIIKALLAKSKELPTIIFDEIDTGVSGEVAKKLGAIMREMSQHMQVIAITHLPQIASCGSSHYKVFKTDDATTTQTQIAKLEQEERVMELAEMIAGKNPSESAINSAKEMLNE